MKDGKRTNLSALGLSEGGPLREGDGRIRSGDVGGCEGFVL